MYLFPRMDKLPQGMTDFDYCMSLLEETGLCTVNGSGFGQKPGTHHLRIAFLPPADILEQVLPRWTEFHNRTVAGTPGRIAAPVRHADEICAGNSSEHQSGNQPALRTRHAR